MKLFPKTMGGIPPLSASPEALMIDKFAKYRIIIELSAAPREPQAPQGAPRVASNLKLRPACSRAGRGVTLA
jgi:hypothetical protein